MSVEQVSEEVEPVEVGEVVEPGEAVEKPFDGEYDPARARRTITALREENKQLKVKAETPKPDPESESLRGEVAKLRVALRLGLPEKLAARLQGATEEELIEDASALLDLIAPQKQEPVTRIPKQKLLGGTTPHEEPELDAASIAAKLRL